MSLPKGPPPVDHIPARWRWKGKTVLVLQAARDATLVLVSHEDAEDLIETPYARGPDDREPGWRIGGWSDAADWLGLDPEHPDEVGPGGLGLYYLDDEWAAIVCPHFAPLAGPLRRPTWEDDWMPGGMT